ncbi:hypothetical protein L288_20040 [Sphingobium quisquiliarum P25]|uniref:Glycerol-3-phosphate dehydrogenase n=1 Tax=Sphingobium quisquiliarum P25 TaxID=1329909 RepID=T0HJ28_9SPHN|nr:glycerol-3-phosphate dehydrogenase [Sphingobium quisquiliarum]EQA99324.1 hypothetical protein L288_20040 [Sphingobium quisquiliarum P25]
MESCDLLIIGGGINGAGIARDAAGRGLKVMLVEQHDLASHTSSASTKLIHGGLRYLEYGEVRLVREALAERERLWGMAPHIIWPLRFVIPQTHSPRPAWMLRAGLFLYDHIGGSKRLPATRTIALDRSPLGDALADRTGRGFVYSDCWVEDSRLVVLNALDAAERGARVLTHTSFAAARREGAAWAAVLEGDGGRREVRARALVNAAGPWVSEVIGRMTGAHTSRRVRLVKGSHIVVPRLYDGEHAFLLQNADRRIMFAIPYEGRFTLIGTTEEAWDGPAGPAAISSGEVRYLLDGANRYFSQQLSEADLVWSYAGIRPLYDDSSGNASAVTRDYVLDVDADGGSAPVLSVFGGKITTYRRLAEQAMKRLAPFFPEAGPAWTAGVALPGGDMPGGDFARFADALLASHPGLPPTLLLRLARAYGTRVTRLLKDAQSLDALGEDLGGGLTTAELDYLASTEWARSAQDVLYRRSKLGLHVPQGTAERVEAYLAAKGGK